MARQCNVDGKERREAVLCLLRREEPAAVIARRIRVSEPTLYRWRDEFLAAGAALSKGSGKKGADPRDRRIAELEAQIELPRGSGGSRIPLIKTGCSKPTRARESQAERL
jgi:transposase-like protein